MNSNIEWFFHARMRQFVKYALVTSLALFVLSPQYAEENQNSMGTSVSFDIAEKVKLIDADLNSKFELFNYPFFIQAEAFQIAENSFQIEIKYKKKGEIVTELQTWSGLDMQQFRDKFSAQLEASNFYKTKKQPKESSQANKETKPDREGIYTFLATTTYAGFMDGVLLLMMGNLASSDSALSLVLFSGAAGFFIPYFITKDQEVSKSMSVSSYHGLIRGYVDFALLNYLILGDKQNKPDLMASSLIVGSSLEFGLGIYYNQKFKLTEGEASALFLSSGLGYVLGIEIDALFSKYDFAQADRISAGLTLGFGLGGLFFGQKLIDWAHYAPGDANVVGYTIFFTTLWLESILFKAKAQQTEAYAAMAIVGTLGGLYLGHLMIENHDFTNLDTLLMGLGTTAFTFLGLGIISSGNISDDNALVVLSSTALAGYFIMYFLLEKDASLAAKSESDNLGFHFDLNFTGLVTLIGANMIGNKSMLSMQHKNSTVSDNLPLVVLTYNY